MAGKLQRDPATGKGLAHHATGKGLSANDDNACCCGVESICANCPDATPARYTVSLGSLQLCDCLTSACITIPGGGAKLTGDDAAGITACLYYLGSDSCQWFCVVYDPEIYLTFYEDEDCLSEVGSVQATFIDFFLTRTATGFALNCGVYFESLPDSCTVVRAGLVFYAGDTPVENCNEPFVLSSELADTDCAYSTSANVYAYGGSASIAPSEDCICESGELCPDPCVLCSDCPPYSTTTTTLRLVLDGLSFGFCGDCDWMGPTGDSGNGVCIDPDIGDPALCKECAGGPHASCGNTGVTDKTACLAAGDVWCCHAGLDDGGGVSPCDGLPLDDDVILPLVSHTATTQTFSDTIGGAVYTVVHTCAVGHTASTFDVTVISGGRCRMRATIGGSCAGGGGSVFTFDDTDLSNGQCAGNGQGHGQITINWGCCS